MPPSALHWPGVCCTQSSSLLASPRICEWRHNHIKMPFSSNAEEVGGSTCHVVLQATRPENRDSRRLLWMCSRGLELERAARDLATVLLVPAGSDLAPPWLLQGKNSGGIPAVMLFGRREAREGMRHGKRERGGGGKGIEDDDALTACEVEEALARDVGGRCERMWESSSGERSRRTLSDGGDAICGVWIPGTPDFFNRSHWRVSLSLHPCHLQHSSLSILL